MNSVYSSSSHQAVKARNNLFKVLYDQRFLLLMSVPFILWIFFFSFGPMYGWLMAFQDYNINKGVIGSPFVGFKHFVDFFKGQESIQVIRNTVAISMLGIIAGNFFPMVFALLINEVPLLRLKKTIQTISYLPHFVSFVVVSNIFLTIFGIEGNINSILMNLGIVDNPVQFWGDKDKFWGMVTFVGVWKEIGWGSIIYLATIASVDVEQYESAIMDGCNRFRRILHITIPSILPVVALLWILSLSDIFNAGFDASYLLGNPANRETSNVIDTYVYQYGIAGGMYSFTTAISLLKVVVGFILVYITNTISRRFSEYSLW